jgi:hypothetical protein
MLALAAVMSAGGIGCVHAETDVERAGSNNVCLQKWVSSNELSWKSQKQENGNHTIVYDDQTTAIEHADGSVDIVTTEVARSGKTIKLKQRICNPGAAEPNGSPPDTTSHLAAGAGLTAEEAAWLQCATPAEQEQIQDYLRGIERINREIEDLEKPWRDAVDAAKKAEAAMKEVQEGAPENGTEDPDYYQKFSVAEQALNEARKKVSEELAKILDSPRFRQLTNALFDTAKELRSLLESIEDRGTCPPPVTPEHSSRTPGEDPVKDALGHIRIGIGGHHDDKGDKRGGEDKPAKTDAPPLTPHD